MNEPADFSQNDTIEEELVAYLDGELDDAESSRIERRLADDSQYRSRLQRLQQAWDMLDYLPREQASEVFTQSTVELVAVKAVDEVERRETTWIGRSGFVWWMSAACILVGLMVGYVVTRVMVTADNRQFVRDLPVIENLDLYYHVDDIEFLRQLDAERIFRDELGEVDHAS